MNVLSIRDAKEICGKIQASSVVIIALDEHNRTFALSSYGETVAACKRARKSVDWIADKISKREVFPDL